MPKKYPFEFLVDEQFFKTNQQKKTVMIIVDDADTHIVYLEGYDKLGKGVYRLLGSVPPPGKEQYSAVLRINTRKESKI